MRLTKAERAVMAKMGKKGGDARADKLTPERRKEIALMGVEARRVKKMVAGLTYEVR